MPIYQGDSTKDGRTWYFMTYKKDFNGVNKKYKSKKYKTKTEAKEAERLFLMKKNNPVNKLFIDIAEDYFNSLINIKRTSTILSYRYAYNKNIKPYFSKISINNITIQNINNWKLEMQKKELKISYLNKLYEILNSIFKYSMKIYGVTHNPIEICGRFERVNDEVIEDKNKLRYITYDNFNKFISVIDDITWKTFFITLYYTGMRKAEIQALRIKDINFSSNEIIVDKTLSLDYSQYKIVKTKNCKNRKIKMSITLEKQLKEYIKYLKDTYNDYSEDWFLFGCTHYLPRTNIDRYKHYYFQLAKIDEITIHEFRHSHVSLLINQYIQASKEKNMKVDATKFFLMMSDRMGHTVDVMQKTYMHLFDNVQDEIVDLLNNL